MLHSICQQISKTQQWPQDWKRSVSFQSQKSAMPKNAQTTTQLHSFHMLARQRSKSFKLGSTVHELKTSRCTSWIQKRQRNQRSNCQPLWDHRKNKRIPEKHLLLLHWLWQSLWLCESQQTVECLKSWEYQTTLPTSWETCMQIKKQVRIGYRTDWFQTGKGVRQGYILSSCLFNICKVSTSFKMPGWMKHKLESRLVRDISITSDM